MIGAADAAGITAIVGQQFDVAHQVLSHGLVPILEPEVTVTIPDKAEAEDLLLDRIGAHLDDIPEGRRVMLKLSLPTVANHYRALIEHPKVMRVVALSGGYSRDEADALLAPTGRSSWASSSARRPSTSPKPTRCSTSPATAW